MQKVFSIIALALVAALGLAQMESTMSLQDALTAAPEDAQFALYTQDTQELIGYSADASRSAFQFTLAPGYTGPATLVIEHADGTAHTFDVQVTDGSITFEDTAFQDMLTQAGFENAQVVSQELGEDMMADAPAFPEGEIGAGGAGEAPGEGDADGGDADGGDADGGDAEEGEDTEGEEGEGEEGN